MPDRVLTRPILRDTIIATVMVGTLTGLAVLFDFSESWLELTRKYESYELDELSGFILGLILASTWFALRRLAQVQRELEARGRVERQLVQARKMEAIGRAAGEIAHDFNNELAIVLGHADVLERNPVLEGNGSVRIIQETVRRASRMTHRLLEFSRPQLELPDSTDLVQRIAEIEESTRALLGPEVDFVVRVEAELWPARVDAERFEQVLINLAINARDAMPGGGQLEIIVENHRPSPAIEWSERLADAEVVRILCRDTGTGMDRKILDRLFEPFFTHGKGKAGTGLGLSIVYSDVMRWGGDIQVQSQLGEGTTFEILIPRSLERPVVRPPKPSDPPPPSVSEGSEKKAASDHRAEAPEVAAQV